MTQAPYPYITRTANARIAGSAFLVYIAIGMAGSILFAGATSTEGITANLASIAEHATAMRVSAVLGLLTPFVAMVLATALYAITREQDRFLAMLAMTSLFGAGVLDGIYIPTTLGLLSLAESAAANTMDTSTLYALGSFLLEARSWDMLIAATFFAVGSTIFSWLLLRGRMIPAALAWLGVIASGLWVVGLPLQLVGVVPDSVTAFIYLPMAVFEISLGLWLLVKGITVSTAHNISRLHADPAL
jgi:hypothetical protein